MIELLEKAIPRDSVFKAYLNNCVEYISKLRPDLTRDRIENYIKNVLVAKNQKMINNFNQAIEVGADLSAVRHGEDRLWPTINAIRSSDPQSDSKARSYGNLTELKNYDLSAWMNDYKNKIISPFGTSYETVDKCSSFLKGMVDMKKAERKKEKKLMLKAKKEGNKTAEVFHNNNQATIKINMNSYIGAMGSGYNNLSSIANYNSVTSISRFFIMNSYAHAERFLESNFYFRNEEQLINFIVTCNLLGPAPERINEVNIDVYAYGYKKEGSELEYCDPGLVKKRFDKLTSEGHYEVIDEDGYADASYEVVEYLGEENKDAIVNGIPVKDFIKLEMEARIKKSDELRGPTF